MADTGTEMVVSEATSDEIEAKEEEVVGHQIEADEVVSPSNIAPTSAPVS